jgi:hypothetical protein
MSKASVSLLLASLVIGAPTSSHAGPATGSSVTDSFAITVNSLNKMRAFAKACGLSQAAETIAQDFMSLFSLQSGLSILEVNKFVQDAYDTAPEATGLPRDCDRKYVRFWTEAFRQRSQELDEVLTRYKQHK